MDVWEALEQHRGKVLAKLDTYPDAYHRHFARWQGEAITMVEIGVGGGGSLQLWRSYFGPKARIVGIDIDPSCKAHEEPGIEVFIGDQTDRAFLGRVADAVGSIDIVLDDGGHEGSQQIASFEALYHRLAPAGIYICEDLQSSYLPSFGPARLGRPHEGSFISFAKEKLDELHAWFSEGAEPSAFTRSTASVHVYPGMAVFERGERPEPRAIAMLGEERYSVPMSEIAALWEPRG